MIAQPDDVSELVRRIERNTYQSTTYEPALKAIEQACEAIEDLAPGDRAAELARELRDAVGAERPRRLKRRIYTTAIGEKLEVLQEYMAMRAEQSEQAGRSASR
jgi:hypothetical protein